MILYLDVRMGSNNFFVSFTDTLLEVHKTCLVMKRADLAFAHLSFLALKNPQLSDISTPRYLQKFVI